MKLKELLEAPTYIDKEAPFAGRMQKFYSQETLDRDFKFIVKGKSEPDNEDFLGNYA